MEDLSFIITAGGIGKRMNSDLPKQFIEIDGKPILLHTLERIHSICPKAQLIITLPLAWKEMWENILKRNSCAIDHTIVDGGSERYHSVKNALELCKGNFVAVHDGVRPLVNAETINNCVNQLEGYGQVIPVQSLNDSIRELFDDTSRAVDRSRFCLVQTPQFFKKEVLKIAYSIPYHTSITDDASLVEEAGYIIHLVEGNIENIKITTPIDLILAREIMSMSK